MDLARFGLFRGKGNHFVRVFVFPLAALPTARMGVTVVTSLFLAHKAVLRDRRAGEPLGYRSRSRCFPWPFKRL